MKVTRYAIKLMAILLAAIVLGAAPVFAAGENGENKLYFNQVDNKLYYDSTLFNAAKFMNHLSMAPGDTYHDELWIQNKASLGYSLSLQAVPVRQSSDSDNLLEKISMKIYLDGKLQYDGKVTGTDYTGSGVNLQNNTGTVKGVSIGNYAPGQQSKLDVYLEFSPSYQPSSTVVTSEIDWKFWGTSTEPNPNSSEVYSGPSSEASSSSSSQTSSTPSSQTSSTPSSQTSSIPLSQASSNPLQQNQSSQPGQHQTPQLITANPYTGGNNPRNFVVPIVITSIVIAVFTVIIGSRRKRSD